MNRTAMQTTPRRVGRARRQRRIVRYLGGGLALAALSLAGRGLLPQHAQNRPTPAIPVGQPVSDRQVPALLAQARAHDPLLRLPHARWFIRVRHDHAQLVVIDHASLRGGGGSVTGTGERR